MSCNVGTRVKDLYKCGTTLYIGDVALAGADYLIYFKNWTTGKIFVIPTTSTIVNKLTPALPVDMIDADHDYQVWATLATAGDIDAKVNISISLTVYTSFAVHFRTVYDTNNAVEDLATQVFAVA